MKIYYLILTFFLFSEKDTVACITCNNKLQNEISHTDFGITIITLLSILGVLTSLILVLSKLIASYYKNHGAGYLNPVPLTTASLILGVGLGGFIDGILFHQILQWHEMLSNKITPDTLINKSINMFWDGIFHLSCLIIVSIGIHLLWKLAKEQAADTSKKLLNGGLLAGWGIFNIIEGLIDHQLVQLHNVKEGIDHQLWNIGFLIVSSVLLIIGSVLIVKVLTQYRTKIAHS